MGMIGDQSETVRIKTQRKPGKNGKHWKGNGGKLCLFIFQCL